MIAIDECGLTIFCSKAYGGSRSDRFVTEHSGFLNMLEQGDIILADKGFQISDLLEERGVALNIPPIKTNSQYHPQEVRETRVVGNRRVCVENVIGLAKKNDIIFDTIPAFLHPYVNEIIYNNVFLCNFKSRIIKK